MSDLSTDKIRQQFPALALRDEGKRRIYFDNPAGTQVPKSVVARAEKAMIEQNANLGGAFVTSNLAQELVDDAHVAMAQFYNAPSASQVIFGANMTTLTLAMSRNLQKTLGIGEGDEIVLSRMDHDANIAPWMHVASDTGATIRWIDFDPETYEFADDALDAVLNEKTKIVAFCYASNCTGTINDVKAMCSKAHVAGALTYVDAVQFAPHGVIDVQDLKCDFLVSSAYKFYGPHAGILYGRRDLLERMYAYQVRPALEYGIPSRFETGTAPRETLAATVGAVEHIASLAEDTSGTEMPLSRRAIVQGLNALVDHERALTKHLITGLKSIKGVTVRGITSENALHRRVPTVSITVEGKQPEALAKSLAEDNVFVWSGHNYALEPVARMKLMDAGGVLRIGLAHYNTIDEIDFLLERLDHLT